jgi:hypothetical protein
MITTEIFIENRRLDITEDISSLLTYHIDDIKDVGSRNTNFSKTIVLPGTANNNFLFGWVFDVKVGGAFNPGIDNVGYNFNAAKQADCLIFNDHIQVFKGIIRVLKVIINNGIPEYECAVFGELGGLINSIGREKTEDLDFSIYDHEYSIANITGSWENITGGGYFYPLADYGNVSTDKANYDVSALRPALFVREYISKIITGAGYQFESDIMDTQRFKNLIVPNCQKRFQFLTSLLFYAYTTSAYTLISQPVGDSAPQSVELDTLEVLGSFTSNVEKSEFTYTGSDTYSTFFNIELSFTINGQQVEFTIKLLKNGNPIYNFGAFSNPHAGPNSQTIQVSDLPVTMQTNDVFEVEVTITNNPLGVSIYYMNVDECIWSITTASDVYSDIGLGDTITMNSTLPKNYLQTDFLISVLKLFNLYVYEDKLKPKFLYLKPYVDFYDLNVSGVVDWTYKMDRGRPIEIIPMSQLNSRFYDFKFKPDSDYYNEIYQKRYSAGFGDYFFDSEFDFVDDRTSIELIFSATPLVGYEGADKIVPAYYKQDAAGVENPIDINIRILQAKKITGVGSWDILDGPTTIYSLTSYGYAGNYDDPDAPANDIHFGVPRELFFTLVTGAINVTQFNVYWSSYMAEITDKDSKLLRAFFKLTTRDIYQLDFSKLVYVDGSYFALNKIEDWNANFPDVCKVELLKRINLTY